MLSIIFCFYIDYFYFYYYFFHESYEFLRNIINAYGICFTKPIIFHLLHSYLISRELKFRYLFT